MKEPNTLFNTHIIKTKGMVSLDDGSRIIPYRMDVDIRCTSDSHETLSLTAGNMQIAVKVRDIEKVINEARGNMA